MFKQMRRSLLLAACVTPFLMVLSCTAALARTTRPGFFGACLSSDHPRRQRHGARFRAKPRAIVSLSPTATEMLYAIGAGSQVKAVDQYSDYPNGTPITDLDGNDPNVEAIASYKPDLVILVQDTSSLNDELNALGITVLNDPAAVDLNQEYQQLDQLGEATGHVAQAKGEMNTIKAKITQIVKSTPRPAHRETYYYELDQTYYSVTSSTFIGQVLGLLGLRSIADPAEDAHRSGGYPAAERRVHP